MRSLARRPRAGLVLALLASLGLGIARAWAVPPGYNVDEWARLPAAIRLAGCWRQTATWVARAPGAESPAACWRAGHFAGNPAYYLILSIPIAFVPDDMLSAQYHLARLVTVGLGLVTVWLAWLTCRELLGAGRRSERLRLIAVGIAAATALNQSFGDIVSGVNSDASAALALGILIYGMARYERRQDSAGQRALSTVVIGLWLTTYWTPTSSAFRLGLPVLIWWVVSHVGPRFRLAAIAAALAGLIAALAIPGWVVEWNSPQYWFNAGSTEILGMTHRVEATGPLGAHALLTQENSGRQTKDEVQYLPDPIAARLAGQPITIGAWLKGPPGQEVQGPIWDDGSQRVSPKATTTGDWQFVAATTTVSPVARAAAIFLTPPAGGAPLLFDGLVVAQGAYPTDAPPDFADASGEKGEWGGRSFTNLLLNPSAEATWPSLLNPRALWQIAAINGRIHSFLAWQRTLAAYPAIASWLFVGFWSEFSGLYPGLGRAGLLLPAMFLAAGAAGAAMTARSSTGPPELQRAVRFFAPIAAIIWMAVILRSDLWPNLPVVLSFAGARYAVTATAPTMALLTIGALYWLPARWHGRPEGPVSSLRRNILGPLGLLAVLALALWLISIHVLLRAQIPFYQCLLGASGAARCLTGN